MPKRMIRALFRTAGVEVTRYRRDGPMGRFFSGLVEKGFRPAAVVDVGANHGEWTLLAAKYFPQAQFLMVEPQEEMRPFLDGVKAKVGKAEWILAGAGAEPGELSLTVHQDSVHSSLLGPCPYPVSDSGTARKVKIRTLDELVTKHLPTHPQLIKVDTEGFEVEVLKGAATLFGNVEIFVIEVAMVRMWKRSPILREVITFMSERGYEAFDFIGPVSGRSGGFVNQVDVAFAKRQGSVFGDWQTTCE